MKTTKITMTTTTKVIMKILRMITTKISTITMTMKQAMKTGTIMTTIAKKKTVTDESDGENINHYAVRLGDCSGT